MSYTLYNYTDCDVSIYLFKTNSRELPDDHIEIPSLSYYMIDLSDYQTISVPLSYSNDDGTCSMSNYVDSNYYFSYLDLDSLLSSSIIFLFYLEGEPPSEYYAALPNGQYTSVYTYSNIFDNHYPYSIERITETTFDMSKVTGTESDMLFPTSNNEGIYPIFTSTNNTNGDTSNNTNGDTSNSNNNTNGDTSTIDDDNKTFYRVIAVMIFVFILVIVCVIAYVIYKKHKKQKDEI